MTATTAAKVSQENVFKNFDRRARATNGIYKNWRSAAMYKKTIEDNETGKVRVRYGGNFISSHAFKVGMALASSAVIGDSKRCLKRLDIEPVNETKHRPWSASITPGAAFQLNQFFEALTHEVMTRAVAIRDTVGFHSRNHKSVIELAIKDVKKHVIDPSSGMPASVTILPMKLARKKKQGEEEAPGEKVVADDDDDKDDDKDDDDEGDEGDEAKDAEE